jgi:hypothetical protein
MRARHAAGGDAPAAGCGRSGPAAGARPRPSSSAILGSCVVLPEPVSPADDDIPGAPRAPARSRRAAPTPAARGSSARHRVGRHSQRKAGVHEARIIGVPARGRAAEFRPTSFPTSLVFPHTFVPWFRAVAP